jgi:hypothetical protein
LLESTEGDLRFERVHAVDPRCARVQAVCYPQGTSDVLAENGGGESVGSIVGLTDDVCIAEVY